MDDTITRLHPEVTRGKLMRDAEKLRAYARFVIVIKDSGIQVIDNNVERRTKGLPYARLIAVLGPVSHGEGNLEGLLLEIGYSRTRPYASLEHGGTRETVNGKAGHRTEPSWSMKKRVRARAITLEELSSVYPTLVSCMEEIVLECRELWKTKGPWWIDGPGEVERGVHFTINEADTVLLHHMMQEDVRYRLEKYINRHAGWVRRLLKKYRLSWYSAKQLKSFAGARTVADLLCQGHYKPLYRVALIRTFDGSHLKPLLESIVETFAVDVELTEHEVAALSTQQVGLSRLTSLRCYKPQNQPSVHAKNAMVFELVPGKNFRERVEIPF